MALQLGDTAPDFTQDSTEEPPARYPLASTGFRCRVQTSSGDVRQTSPSDAVTDDTAFSMVGVAG